MNRSGQVTVTTAGTAVQGDDVPAKAFFYFMGHPDNTDSVWLGNVSGDVASTNGFALGAGEKIVMYLANLSDLWFDADVSGEKICWIWSDK